MSTIPGIHEFHTELKNSFLEFAEKTKNILTITDDQTFEKNSATFDTGVKKFKSRLKTHLVKTVIDEASDYEYKIELLKKWEQLNLTGLGLKNLYIKISKALNTCKLYSRFLKITLVFFLWYQLNIIFYILIFVCFF